MLIKAELDEALFEQRAMPKLTLLYGPERARDVCNALVEQLVAFVGARQRPREGLWDERDVLLITYGASVQSPPKPPMATLRRFLSTYVQKSFAAVHILPFCPYSSDDGFSVINYREVDSALGTWSDVLDMHEHFDLMMDLVLNHASRQSLWFRDYVDGVPPADRYFLEVDGDADVSQVVRPRPHDLRIGLETSRGPRHVWATFSDDQIDLDYSNPAVLLEMLDILLLYVRMGARFVRLDAVAFLWKRLGTRCVHLPETHAVVKLMRDVVDAVAPGTVLITETNVPHTENVSYFGDGDEAHMVYQFSMAPLLLDAVFQGEAAALTAWARNLAAPPAGCTFLNFTSSHDGIGLRPLEGVLPQERTQALVRGMQSLGAYVSLKVNADGSKSPYEINITWFHAMGGTRHGHDDGQQIPRFFCTQLAMLAFRGIPAVYIHTLFGTPNDYLGVDKSGRARSINRRRYDRTELEGMLDDPDTDQHKVFEEMRRLLILRRAQPAFHPDAPQAIHDLDARLFVIDRQSLDGEQRIIAAHNVSKDHVVLPLAGIDAQDCVHDLLSGTRISEAGIQLAPYECVWLTQRRY